MSSKGAWRKGEGSGAENQRYMPGNSKWVQNDCEDDLTAPKAAQDAMTNELILECVFKNLATRDLVRECRRVSRQWNRVATKILKKRPGACVKVSAQTNVKALEACIASSTDFPFREIDLKISCTDFRNSPKKWLEVELFRQHSIIFTRLRLAARYVPDAVLIAILSGPLRQIQSLELRPIRRRHGEENREGWQDSNGNPLKLLNLKSVAITKFVDCHDVDLIFLTTLLQSCPNLQRIDNFSNAHLRVLSISGKLGAVKSFRACRQCINNGRNYPLPSRVEKLTIAGGWHRYEWDDKIRFDALCPLLESNRESLQRIKVCTQVAGGTNINDWPKLSNLTSLKLMEPISFPDSVEEIFPALKSVQLYPSQKFRIGDYMWKKPLSSVTTLEVFRPISRGAWKFLSTSVPNIRRVLLHTSSLGIDCKDDRTLFFCDDPMGFWPGLSWFKQLDTCCISPIELSETHMDEFLTGISQAGVDKLRASPLLPVPSPEFIDAFMRETVSVASLSGLKELIIRFTMSDKITREDLRSDRPISHVSLQYGLNMVPADVKIRMMYDHWSNNARLTKEALSPVAERVTFGHWNANLFEY